MNIRPMKIDEAETIVTLWNDWCVEDTGHLLSTETQERILSNLRQYVDHPDCHCLVAEVDDQIVGYITFYLSSHPIQPGYSGEMEDLYVKLDYRNQ